MSRTRMTTLGFIFSKLSSFDGFVSANCFEITGIFS